jgi:hypothetical protein
MLELEEVATSPTSDDGLPIGTRRWLLAGGLMAMGALLSKPAQAQGTVFVPGSNYVDPVSRLVRRLSYGANSKVLAEAKALGYQGYLQSQLNYSTIDDSDCERTVSEQFGDLQLTSLQLEELTGVNFYLPLADATLYRSVFSKRQLFQRMVEFWTDHFNTSWGRVKNLKYADDRDVIRKYAMTTFPQLLKATAHSPAMLHALNNDLSLAKAPNQNYARELMELQTLGVNGGFTQDDVIQVARALTGWTWEMDKTKAGYGEFLYNDKWHDQGAKTIFGWDAHPLNLPAKNGQADGDAVLNFLAHHPSTAKFVSTKLCKWFLAEQPDPAVVSAVTQVWMNTGGDIKKVLEAILSRANLMAAPAKFKRPYHLLVSVLRQLGATVTWVTGEESLGTARSEISNMGHGLFNWDPPNGYPDTVNYWDSLWLPRWSSAIKAAHGTIGKYVATDLTPYAGSTVADVVKAINRELFYGEATATLLAELTTYFQNESSSKVKAATIEAETVGLALSSLEYQFY